MTAFYSEWEAYPAQWTRNLIAAGYIAPGVVDERSISDLSAEDVRGFDQAHFFAGISVWSYALRLAGIPDGFPCWSGSCPCQGFSSAGRKRGFEDERHLWPEWFRLIEANRPPVIFGEQVSSPIGLKWLDLVSSQLEEIGYSFGAIVTCASGIGAPHQRHRMYFVAHTKEFRWGTWRPSKTSAEWRALQLGGLGEVGVMADAASARCDDPEVGGNNRSASSSGPWGEQPERSGSAGIVADADGRRFALVRASHDHDRRDAPRHDLNRCGATIGLGDTNNNRSGWDSRTVSGTQTQSSGEWIDSRNFADGVEPSSAARALGHPYHHHHHQGLAQQRGQPGVSREATDGTAGQATERAGAPTTGFWANAEWVYCSDGKYRPTEPGVAALAAGSPGRVGQIKAYGNALNAWQAATFIRAFIEATYDCTQHL